MKPLEEFSYIPKVERRFDLDLLRMISIVLLKRKLKETKDKKIDSQKEINKTNS